MNDLSDTADADNKVTEPATLLPNPGSLLWNMIIAITVLPLGLFVFSLFGRYSFFAELVNNFRCQIMFMLLPFAFLMLGIRRTWFAIIVFAAVAWSLFSIAGIYLPAQQPPPGPKIVRIMSHNVLGDNEQHVDVIKQIKKASPDIFVIVEYSRHWYHAMKLLDKEYPHQILEARWHGFGIAIFSKLPIINHSVHQLSKSQTDVPFIIATVDIGNGQSLRVAGVHTISPTNRYRMDLRNQQFIEAGQLLLESNQPTIILGDYNCTPYSPFLSDFVVQTGYRDSRQGFGHHASWPHAKYWFAQIPIDHAYVSPGIHVHDRWLGDRCGSDHRAFVVDVSVSEE